MHIYEFIYGTKIDTGCICKFCEAVLDFGSVLQNQKRRIKIFVLPTVHKVYKELGNVTSEFFIYFVGLTFKIKSVYTIYNLFFKPKPVCIKIPQVLNSVYLQKDG